MAEFEMIIVTFLALKILYSIVLRVEWREEYFWSNPRLFIPGKGK